MVWQVTLVALPIYIVIRKWYSAGIAVLIIALTSLILKFFWYDHMKDLEHINAHSAQVPAKAVMS
jgi:hypothetical protein